MPVLLDPGFVFHNPMIGAAAAIARKLDMRMEARKLKGFVKTLDEVDQKYRDLYVEETGPDNQPRFRLDADGVEDVTGLRNTVTTLRRENGELKKKVKPLEELEAEDLDLEEVVTAGRAALEAAASGQPAPEVQREVQRITKAKDKEINALKADNTGLMEALRESVIEGEGSAAIAELRGNKTLLMPHLRGMIDIVRIQDGDKVRYEKRVFEGTGADRSERTGNDGKPLPIKAAVAELRANDDFADAFEGSVAPGTGAPPDGGSGMPTPPSRGRRESAPPAPTAKDAKRATMDYSL
jgi:hypothetical protein